jgi:broad specificity phosphatase PhoE
MILLIRHAQSEGNKNRDIHQYIPDHRVKLTPDGVQQVLSIAIQYKAMLTLSRPKKQVADFAQC